jgi:HEAT repeat protein
VSVTMADVRGALDPDEVDYAFAAQLGPDALPHLMALVEGADPGLAAKAAYLAGKIRGTASEAVVAAAAASDDARVRVAAASAASMLAPEAASRVLTGLVLDADTGVQKLALRSVPAEASPNLRASIEQLSQAGPELAVRPMVTETLDRLA